MFEALIPKRTPEDFASGVIRVRLGRRDLALEELPMEAMDAWSAKVDRELAVLLGRLDRGDDTNAVMMALTMAKDDIVKVLVLYPGVPDEEYLRKNATNSQVLRALMGVWSAANPLVAALVEAVMVLSQSTETGNASELMGTLHRISGGRSAKFDNSSPTRSSSPGLTSRKNGSTSISKPRSRPPVSGRGSPATGRLTPSGAGAPTSEWASDVVSRARRSKGRS
ncbi:MAG TPA: hypothetical protein VI341_13610 [Actinomycetota bacterium]